MAAAGKASGHLSDAQSILEADSAGEGLCCAGTAMGEKGERIVTAVFAAEDRECAREEALFNRG